MNGMISKTSFPIALLVISFAAGCGSETKKDRDFHTSGSRDADQRAEQTVAKVQQLRGEGGKEQDVKKSLYDRLGKEDGIAIIVEDFVNRALADPRVNWERKGVTVGGWTFKRGKSVEWSPSPENGTKLKKHMTQFLALATGGPAVYAGGEMAGVHANMHITNAEFDASIGDLKASLDNLKIPTAEQKELLAIAESTRPQVVTQR